MSIQKIAIDKAITLLAASGALFHVKHGDKEWGEPVNKVNLKFGSKYPRGAMTSHIAQNAQNVTVGDVVCIPYAEFDAKTLSNATTGYLSNRWGNGSYISSRAPLGIEVLRLK